MLRSCGGSQPPLAFSSIQCGRQMLRMVCLAPYRSRRRILISSSASFIDCRIPVGFGFSRRVLSSRVSVVHSSLIECRESVRLFVEPNRFRRLIKTASLTLSGNSIECGETARHFVVSNRARRTASLPASAVWGSSIECGQSEGSRRVSSTRRVVVFAAAPQLGGVGEPGWGLGLGDEQQLREGLKNGSGTGNGRSSRLFAKWKFWGRRKETALSKDDALPLPMTYPGSKPLPKEEVEKMAQCDPEKEDCKPVVYQWTGECRRCQGTGSGMCISARTGIWKQKIWINNQDPHSLACWIINFGDMVVGGLYKISYHSSDSFNKKPV